MRALTMILMALTMLSAACAGSAQVRKSQLPGVVAPAPVRPLVLKLVMQTVSQYGVDVAAWFRACPIRAGRIW